jgi:hypothetical protein
MKKVIIPIILLFGNLIILVTNANSRDWPEILTSWSLFLIVFSFIILFKARVNKEPLYFTLIYSSSLLILGLLISNNLYLITCKGYYGHSDALGVKIFFNSIFIITSYIISIKMINYRSKYVNNKEEINNQEEYLQD